jgi:HTH-type transcriptional repressor of NAD biosynthesis genes
MLVTMLRENNIEFLHVQEDDYDTRFLRCIELVKAMLGEKNAQP